MRGVMWRLAQMYLGALHFGFPQKTAFSSLEWPLVVDLNESVFAQWRKQIDCGVAIVEPEGISSLRCITGRDAAESAIECAGRGEASRAYVMDGVEEIPVSDVIDRMRVVYGPPGLEVPHKQKRQGKDGPVSSEVSFREEVLPSAGLFEVHQFFQFLTEKAHVLSPEAFKNEVKGFVSAGSFCPSSRSD